MTSSSSSSCILWQNDRKTVVLLDLPRSIEEAQVPSSELTAANGAPPPKPLRRLISALPPAVPFPTPEPKAGGSDPPAASPSAQLADLMTQAAVESALEEIRGSYDGPWCLPRISSKHQPSAAPPPSPPSPPPPPPSPSLSAPASTPPSSSPSRSQPPTPVPIPAPTFDPSKYHLPPLAHPLPGTISSHRSALLSATPAHAFDLILLDPPWPNRSAKRKRAGPGAYRPAADLSAVRALLRQIPVASRLAPGGLVAVWVTNAPRFVDLLTGPPRGGGGGGGGGGVFAEWDVELVGEWTWAKVTTAGEPVVAVGSAWRKPWERLLIARRRKKGPAGGGEGEVGGGGSVPGKVIVAVPDVHSRKPNLRGLFEELLPRKYEAMEVFARNLTAGWWGWGDEVLLFQRRECWVYEGKVEEEGGGGL